jgi:uncharacterized protein (DUF488 family)
MDLMAEERTVYTIGFAGKSAAQFFGLLQQAKIKRVVDVRLNNVSQLAGFTKREDLRYFLKELCGAEYKHEPLLAPTKEILEGYRKDKSWTNYTTRFLRLLDERQIEKHVDPQLFDVATALLCSEPTADKCHRRLVLEYLQSKWGDVRPHHL